MTSEREEKLEKILAQFIQPINDVPLEIFIRAWFKYKVFHFDPETNATLFEILKILGENTCESSINSPIKSNRPNEVGNKLEDYVKNAGKRLKLDVDKPSGFGYPDLKLMYNNTTTYIEVKSYNQNSINSSFRSFYLSPPKRPKINSDGFHLIFGFEVESVESGFYCATGFHIADAYGLSCSMKFEAQSNNAIMYSENQVLYSWNRSSDQGLGLTP